MAEVLKFPTRPAPDPERPITLAEYLHRGAPPVMTLRAALRWFGGFDPRGAAVHCVLVCETHAERADWWRAHIALFRAALARRRLAPEDVARLATEYTEATRQEVKALRAERRPRTDWKLELICGLAGAPFPDRPELPPAPRAEGGA